MGNFLCLLSHQKQEDYWVFDDNQYDLVKEPFMLGAGVVLEWPVTDMEDSENGFKLLFAENSSPATNPSSSG
ncbi:MAG: hypothetical protein AAF589_01170 [Planctomycetota bacterium]